MQDLMYIKEAPWNGLGISFDKQPTTADEIIEKAALNWTVGVQPMYTEIHDKVMNYHAVYREDTNQVLGVVNKAWPQPVQNLEAFQMFESLLGSDLEVETASRLGYGERVFGSFKILEPYKILDEDYNNHIVMFNEHSKADGKITIVNTPMRVSCANMMSEVLSKSLLKYRVMTTTDTSIRNSVVGKIVNSAGDAMLAMNRQAEFLVNLKLTRENIETILDELFPFTQVTGEGFNSAERANEKIEMERESFLEMCMNADHNQNYKGTAYQVLNAITDFEQHYFKNLDKGMDLNSRMKLVPGSGLSTEPSKTIKFLKLADKLAA